MKIWVRQETAAQAGCPKNIKELLTYKKRQLRLLLSDFLKLQRAGNVKLRFVC